MERGPEKRYRQLTALLGEIVKVSNDLQVKFLDRESP
jgi:hypothetical protein